MTKFYHFLWNRSVSSYTARFLALSDWRGRVAGRLTKLTTARVLSEPCPSQSCILFRCSFCCTQGTDYFPFGFLLSPTFFPWQSNVALQFPLFSKCKITAVLTAYSACSLVVCCVRWFGGRWVYQPGHSTNGVKCLLDQSDTASLGGWTEGMGLDLFISADSGRHLNLTGSSDFVSEVIFECVLFNFQEI